LFDSFYEALTAIGYTHPAHPLMTNLPLGMVMGALVFTLVGLASRRYDIVVTAHHCLILALISAFPTMLLGYLDWHHYYGGAWLLPIKMKILLAFSLIMLLSLGVWLRSRVGTESKAILLVYVLSFLNAVGLGYFGGELVFGAANTKVQEATSSEPTSVSYADVEEIFRRDCIVCHSGSNAPLGLRLDSYEHSIAGGQSGPVIIPGKPDESDLVRRITGIDQPRMPFGKPPLLAYQIGLIISWIQQGASENIKTDPGN
jgi:uncharacterized membrane protein